MWGWGCLQSLSIYVFMLLCFSNTFLTPKTSEKHTFKRESSMGICTFTVQTGEAVSFTMIFSVCFHVLSITGMSGGGFVFLIPFCSVNWELQTSHLNQGAQQVESPVWVEKKGITEEKHPFHSTVTVSMVKSTNTSSSEINRLLEISLCNRPCHSWASRCCIRGRCQRKSLPAGLFLARHMSGKKKSTAAATFKVQEQRGRTLSTAFEAASPEAGDSPSPALAGGSAHRAWRISQPLRRSDAIETMAETSLQLRLSDVWRKTATQQFFWRASKYVNCKWRLSWSRQSMCSTLI